MSGAMRWKGDDNWQATCDLCPWVSQVDSHEGVWAAQRDHETRCRPPLPDEIPDIDFPWPPCPVCDGDLGNDGGEWYCQRCEVGWASDGTRGSFIGADNGVVFR